VPTTIRFVEVGRYVESLYSGVVGPEEYDRSVTDALDLARARGEFRFLSDLTDLAKGPSPGDIFAMVQSLEHLGLPRSLREAIVLPPASPDTQDVQFYEDACRNRGWDIRIFPDRETAIAWLGTDAAPGVGGGAAN
jgi:hypothetical protein